MTTPLTPILEGYEPLTGEELVSARECAHVGYTTPLMVRRLLQTIAARDETIAGLIEERDGFKNSMVKYFHEAADSQDASLRANVGEPVTADELKKLLLPYTEKSSWSAQWIAEHICKDFGGRTIGPPMPPVNPQSPPEVETPIDMILFCPSCNLQHVDITDSTWENPPHRSHLCHSCGTIWRPADVATNGVSKIKTAGKADVVKSLPPVEPSPIEAARAWIAAIINDHVVTAIAPMIIPPCAKEVWDDFSTTLAARILSPPATETAVAEIDPRKCPMGWCRLNNECFESGNKTSGCPLRAVEPSPLKTSRESTFTQTEKFILNRCQRGKGDPPMDCSYPDCEDYCFTKDQPSPTDAQLTAAICCGDSECPLKEWAAANKRTLDCETDQFDCRVKAVRALLLSRDAAMVERCAKVAEVKSLLLGDEPYTQGARANARKIAAAIKALEPKP